MRGPIAKKNACAGIDASQATKQIFEIINDILPKCQGNIFRHKNRTKTGIQRAIDRAFYRFIEENKAEDALDLKDSSLCSRGITEGIIYTINGNPHFIPSWGEFARESDKRGKKIIL